MRRPRFKETTRPWRLLDTVQNALLRWRYYKTQRRAEESALIEIGWATVGTTIEVYNPVTGRVSKTFTVHADGQLYIWKGHHALEQRANKKVSKNHGR